MTNFKFIALVAVLLFLGYCSLGQSITVYKSPHKIKKTLTKVLASIDSNQYKLVSNREFKTKSDDKEKFSGTVYLVEFEIPEVYELASCEPTAILDMPLKVILWEEQGDPYIGYMRTNELKKRFLVTQCEEILKTLNKAMIRVVNDAIRTR